MKKLLLATAALLAVTTAASADMALRLQEGALVQDFASAPGQSSFSGPPNFAFGDFVISNITGSIFPSTQFPLLLTSNTLDLQETGTGAHTLDIFVTGTGFTNPTGIGQALSGFTAVTLSNGWKDNLQTLVSVADANFTGTVIDSAGFIGDGITSFASNAVNDAVNFGPGPFSLTAHFQIVTNGPGQANSGIQVAVPGPIVGAGIPGIVAGCMMLLGLGRYRRRRQVG